MAKLPSAIQGARIVGERFVHLQRQQNPEGRMPLMDHIRELRNRVVKMTLALGAGMIVGFVFFGRAFAIIERPLCAAVVHGRAVRSKTGSPRMLSSAPSGLLSRAQRTARRFPFSCGRTYGVCSTASVRRCRPTRTPLSLSR